MELALAFNGSEVQFPVIYKRRLKGFLAAIT